MSVEDRIRRLEQDMSALRNGGVGWSRFPSFNKYSRFIGPSDKDWVGTEGAPLTSTSYDGDSFSTTAKTLIDLSAVFGVPDGVKGIVVDVRIRDSDSANTDCYIILAPVNDNAVGTAIDCRSISDRWLRTQIIVPCDSNGDIYYQIVASGANTFDLRLIIDGYWL